jgi:hypothetical protein
MERLPAANELLRAIKKKGAPRNAAKQRQWKDEEFWAVVQFELRNSRLTDQK